jgi:eukaryotic-like serine/threonine-protein kinase
VVTVYGLGCDSRGRLFYAMRLVKGDTLQEAIDRLHASEGTTVTDPRRWNLALRQLLNLNRFVVVCNVMDYAHSRGVIHRDLKPANILQRSLQPGRHAVLPADRKTADRRGRRPRGAAPGVAEGI